jgi:hypothetical protein
VKRERKGEKGLRDTERQIKYTESRQKGVKRERKGEKGLRDTERQIKYTENRQKVVKREGEGEEEAKGHRETNNIYRKQTDWGVETERRRGRG